MTLFEDRSKAILMLLKETKLISKTHQQIHKQDQLYLVKQRRESQQLKKLRKSSQRNVLPLISKKLS